MELKYKLLVKTKQGEFQNITECSWPYLTKKAIRIL